MLIPYVDKSAAEYNSSFFKMYTVPYGYTEHKIFIKYLFKKKINIKHFINNKHKKKKIKILFSLCYNSTNYQKININVMFFNSKEPQRFNCLNRIW